MRFEKTEEGIDNKTNLIWKSEDEPRAFTFDEAIKQAKNTGWRMPTVDELNSIVDRTKHNPACNSIFNMSSSSYWSSSPYANYSDNAWVVNFNNGYVCSGNRFNVKRVRLVRTIGEKE